MSPLPSSLPLRWGARPGPCRAIAATVVPAAALLLSSGCAYTDIVAPTPTVVVYDLLYEESSATLNQTRLAVRNLETGASVGVYGLTVDGAMPTVSADGARVVYVGASTGVSDYDVQDLWTVARGGQPQRITLSEGTELAPALSPDGQRVAYVKLNALGESRLYVARVSGTEERLVAPAIAPGIDTRFASPSWSPDGTRLLFSAGEPGRLHLWIANADGTGMQQVTNAAVSDIDGAWSPNGQQVAFTRTASPASAQIMIRTLATGVERLFAYGFRNRFPAWSPDGLRLAFVSNMEDNLDFELYTVQVNGEGLWRHTWDSARQQSPRWLKR